MFTNLEKNEYVEFFSFSTSLWGLGLYYFPFPFPCVPHLKKKYIYVGFSVGWNWNFSACHSKSFTTQPPTCFQFYLLLFHSKHPTSSPWGFSFLPSAPCVFTSLPLCSGCSVGLRCLLLFSLPHKFLFILQDPTEMFPVFINLSALFCRQVSPSPVLLYVPC